MRTVTDAFLRTLKGSHRIAVRARVVTGFQTGSAPVTAADLEVVDGLVTLDGKADARASLNLTVSPTTGWPIFDTDPLAPYGNEIFVERGVWYNATTVEYVPLGYFRIQAADQDSADRGPINVTGVDRMQAIIEARLLAPRQYLSGTTFSQIVDDLVLEIYPSAVINYDDATNLSTLTRTIISDDDRYGLLRDLGKARGKLIYFDGAGVLQIVSPPPQNVVVYEIELGAGGTLVDLRRALSRDGTYNAAVALGEGGDTDTPFRGVALDDNPASPTYFYGRFGQVPQFFSSPFVNSQAQADAAAQAILAGSLGLPYSISAEAVVNPALEPFDVVRFAFSYAEAAQIHVLDVVRIPLSEQPTLSVETRQQSVTLASGS